ncbi:polysaccharide pyruvyl transferase family protein [Calothrix sp. CCY 0018]|uniref:polysaccharide pyruvyl transferase family protein n=1 Tax=Calothrix sp. CCY 0018 TaxID=3103864 RepID=UPI0039C68DD1
MKIKQFLKFSMLALYANLLRLKRVFQWNQKQNDSVLLLPPARFGSLGDEAMITAVIEYFKGEGAKQIGFISYSLASNWENFKPAVTGINTVCHSLSDSWKENFHLVTVASRYDKFYCLGADVMDGFYSEKSSLTRLKYVSLAKQTGAEAAILGFSFNEQPAPKVIQAFRNLSSEIKLYSRDPVSHKRLINYLQRSVTLVADLAFLLPPAENPGALSEILQWIKLQQQNQRILIGINANSQSFSNIDKESVHEIIKIYVDTLVEIHSKYQKCSFVLIPHDFRNTDKQSSDIRLSEAILNALPKGIRSDCVKVPTPFSAAEIKSVCKHLDIVLTGRMHLCIACLSQGTPVGCITYQGKFQGLFEHIELDGMLIDPEQACQPGYLSNFFIPLIQHREYNRQRIQEIIPKVKQLALANFK